MKRLLWITWEHHRRTVEIARELGIPLIEICPRYPPLLRYVYSTAQTVIVLLRYRPAVLVTQNPSYILNLLTVFLKPIFRYRLVIDQHNEGIHPDMYQSSLYRSISSFISAHADFNIVTNDFLAEIVHRNGSKPIVLHDKIPVFQEKRKVALGPRFNLVFICTFARDEPYIEVISAAGELKEVVTLYVTGNYSKIPSLKDSIDRYENVVFTGFLLEADYINLLHSADAIIDLTSRDNCLVCGAYEAVALEKPLITSDTNVLRSLFSKGVVYTDNTRGNLVDAIRSLMANYPALQHDISMLKEELGSSWQDSRLKMQSLLLQ